MLVAQTWLLPGHTSLTSRTPPLWSDQVLPLQAQDGARAGSSLMCSGGRLLGTAAVLLNVLIPG